MSTAGEAEAAPLAATSGRSSGRPPSVYPFGPEWTGKVIPYTALPGTSRLPYAAPHLGTTMPPPSDWGTMKRPTSFRTQPAPEPRPDSPFGKTTSMTVDLRTHSGRSQPGRLITVKCKTSDPVGRFVDAAVMKAYGTGQLEGYSNRIIGVFGPSGRQLNLGYTLYDQSPVVPPGATIVLVWQD